MVNSELLLLMVRREPAENGDIVQFKSPREEDLVIVKF